MFKYKGTKKDVVIDGEKFKAFFPKTHLKVKGIVYNYKEHDRNAGDLWANCRDWVKELTLYVLWKGKDEWEKLSDPNDKNLIWDTNNMGTLDGALFDLEPDFIRDIYDLNEEWNDIQKNIVEEKERLKQIKKEVINLSQNVSSFLER